MAFEVAAVKGGFVSFIVACMATSAVSDRSSDVTATPHLKFSTLGAISEVALAVEWFLPCLEALKVIEGCTVEIFKAVFELPLDASCCQFVNQIAKNCLPKGFPLSQVFLPIALENCINAPISPAII
ncbi:Uncharacterized protein Adt_48337 [Abeliophyllum distichum]|uniref:Prolamin-like domain-containing protein n=1 Tax=Abeliophyllum distichum TaxID=126358 RepID=A0ABD1NRD3_9LAMI